MMGKVETLKYLNGLLEHHRRQITHFERGIEGFQEAVDQPQSMEAVVHARRKITAYQRYIDGHQNTIASIEQAVIKEEARGNTTA